MYLSDMHILTHCMCLSAAHPMMAVVILSDSGRILFSVLSFSSGVLSMSLGNPPPLSLSLSLHPPPSPLILFLLLLRLG